METSTFSDLISSSSVKSLKELISDAKKPLVMTSNLENIIKQPMFEYVRIGKSSFLSSSWNSFHSKLLNEPKLWAHKKQVL
jgi:hypothetical protein